MSPGLKADIGAHPRHVRFTPKSGHWNSAARCPLCAKSGQSAAQQSGLFDHLVGAGEHDRRHGEAERLGDLEVDDKIEFRRLQGGKISWLLALENAGDIQADLPVRVGDTRPNS